MNNNIYSDIALRTQGDIYIGVVGPVRTGKSTFIKRFMDTMVIPNIDGDYQKERARDELPQSAAGRTIMTTEPKFVPEEAVTLTMDDNVQFRVRLIDCVGYIVPSSVGYIEEDQPRMVHTPWYDEEIPFNMAAEIGTKKVICEHSTIGLVVTTDGSISSIPREEYEEAEERVIEELKSLSKPFVVLLNSETPSASETIQLASKLSDKYGVPVIPANCLEMTEKEINQVIAQILYEFPVTSVSLDMPAWIKCLDDDNEMKSELLASVKENCQVLSSINSVKKFVDLLSGESHVEAVRIAQMDLSTGAVHINIQISSKYFYQILSDKCSLSIHNEKQLMAQMLALVEVKNKFARFEKALQDVEASGYGIVMPSMDEMRLDEPEIMKQGGRYGVKLKAQAPSIHMIKCNTYTEVAPIVGSESQSQELVMYLLKEFEENPSEIWNTNIFGKPLLDLVNEGLNNKLYRMPEDARNKFRETIERVINEGCSGLICIIL